MFMVTCKALTLKGEKCKRDASILGYCIMHYNIFENEGSARTKYIKAKELELHYEEFYVDY